MTLRSELWTRKPSIVTKIRPTKRVCNFDQTPGTSEWENFRIQNLGHPTK